MPIGRALGDDLGAGLDPVIPAHGAPDLQPVSLQPVAAADKAGTPSPNAGGAERRRRKRGPDGDEPVVVSANAPPPPSTPPDPKTPRFLRRR
jgi:hypothetical protein